MPLRNVWYCYGNSILRPNRFLHNDIRYVFLFDGQNHLISFLYISNSMIYFSFEMFDTSLFNLKMYDMILEYDICRRNIHRKLNVFLSRVETSSTQHQLVYVGFELMKQYFMTTPFTVGEILALEERIYFLLTLTVQTTYMNGNSSNIT